MVGVGPTGVAVGVSVCSTGVAVSVLVAVAVSVSAAVAVAVSVGAVAVAVAAAVPVGPAVAVAVAVPVAVGVAVAVAVGVAVAVAVGVAVAAAQAKMPTWFVSIVTAPLRARPLPDTLAPVVRVMLCKARILPTNVVPVPIVAELPTCQNTLQSTPPLVTRTDALLAVVSVLPIWKMKTAAAFP
jgi:hypothetical protein